MRRLTAPGSNARRNGIFRYCVTTIQSRRASCAFTIMIRGPPRFTFLMVLPRNPVFVPRCFSAAVRHAYSTSDYIFHVRGVSSYQKPCRFSAYRTKTRFKMWVGVLANCRHHALIRIRICVAFRMSNAGPMMSQNCFRYSPSKAITFIGNFLRNNDTWPNTIVFRSMVNYLRCFSLQVNFNSCLNDPQGIEDSRPFSPLRSKRKLNVNGRNAWNG